ncbi:putative O-methyltransferase [Pullulanibacillus camelliae]|uniref:Putative O-methyltransferase n=1 Tax=Pullulanibacillus camelliae TaxID=1707096 RepID=A0A8J2VQB0_9BACL|nr:class I SAM-dependent methyltransferase [Pullulanibacillus camelliae]GGE34975.1 putative O-methyltransferase [Pullulanibacillus camelliae]
MPKPKAMHPIHLDKEKETLLITLYAKALDTHLKQPILNDIKAKAITNRIEYNFEKLNHSGSNHLMVIRAKQLDTWLEAFLKRHSEAVVLNLGCGLDTRISRINPPSSVSWFDVDFPEVIDVRRHFYSDQDNYKMMPSSVTDNDWLAAIPHDKPTMVIAEGILEYLTEEDVQTLFHRLTAHFPQGQIAFDVMNSFAITSGKEDLKKTTGAEHTWAVDTIQRVDQLNPKLTRKTCISVLRSPYTHKLPIKYRLLYRLFSLVPSFKNMIRVLLYEF